jgi:hypothetical protein
MGCVIGLATGCGGGDGGGGPASAARAENVPVTIIDCGGVPGTVINGSFFKVTYARDNLGHLLTPADILKDANGVAKLISDQQATFTSDSGNTTGTLAIQPGALPSC